MKISCPSCGAGIKYMPCKEKCYCKYCDKYILPEEIKTIDEECTYKKLECISCGAHLIIDETNVTTKCVYCGSTNILLEKLKNTFNPHGIIPFKFDEEKALEFFREFVKKHKKYFNEFVDIEVKPSEVKGIYVPYYIYKWTMKMFIGNDNGNYIYEDTEIIEKDCGKKFNDTIMNALQEFEFNCIKKFHPAYLSGFYTEIADEKNFDKVEEKNRVKKIFYDKKEYQKVLKEYYKRDENKEDINYKLFLEQSESALLPVWFVNLENGYSFAINGRTGIVACIVDKEDKQRLVFDNPSENFHIDNNIKMKITMKSKILKLLLKIIVLAAIILFSVFLFFVFDGIPGGNGLQGLLILLVLLIPILFFIMLINKGIK